MGRNGDGQNPFKQLIHVKMESLRFRNYLCGGLFCLGLISSAQAGLKIYYIRHAEVGANVEQEWAKIQTNIWPIYVGNPGIFTPKGEVQVVNAMEKLKQFHYDFIAVSPIWRARQTVLPYLKQTQRQAELWPELAESGGFINILKGQPLPLPSTNLLSREMVSVPVDERKFFMIRKDGRRLFGFDFENLQAAADAVAVSEMTVDLIRKRFGGSNKSILLVGHGNNGRLLLHALMKDNDAWKTRLANTGIWMAEEAPDGSFKLRLFNDAPCGADVSSSGMNK